jgi:hypothetical protein
MHAGQMRPVQALEGLRVTRRGQRDVGGFRVTCQGHLTLLQSVHPTPSEWSMHFIGYRSGQKG